MIVCTIKGYEPDRKKRECEKRALEEIEKRVGNT